MSSLRPGRVMVYGEDKNLLKAFFVSGGFAEVNPEKCIVLAESVDEINSIEKSLVEKEIQDLEGQDNQVANEQIAIAKAKLDALVCSAQEVKLVKKVFKKEIITPGIRFNSKFNDQKRVMTPIKAFKNGSDWLVIGRPITKGNIKKNIQNLINHLNND